MPQYVWLYGNFPMILGIGTDIVQLSRIDALVTHYKERFISRIFTQAETEYALSASCPARQIARLANRFAAKEATLKAIGVTTGISWQDIEVKATKNKPPQLLLHNAAYIHAQSLLPSADDVLRLHLSLSDEKDYSLAFVTLSCVSL